MSSDPAHRSNTYWVALVVGVGLTTAAVGFWAGGGYNAREVPFALQLEHQSAELARINERLAVLAQRTVLPVVHCEAAEVTKPSISEETIARALDTALTRQALAAKADKDALLAPSHDNLEAFTHGEQLVAAALKTSQWTDSQAVSLRNLLSHVTDDQANTLTQRLFVAVNEGKLALHTSGPPF